MSEAKLLAVATWLEGVRPGGHVQFTFGTISGGTPTRVTCGEKGCGLGELHLIFPKHWTVKTSAIGRRVPRLCLRSTGNTYRDAAKYFGVSVDDIDDLFQPGMPRWWTVGQQPMPKTAPPRLVANSIRQFITVSAKLGQFHHAS